MLERSSVVYYAEISSKVRKRFDKSGNCLVQYGFGQFLRYIVYTWECVLGGWCYKLGTCKPEVPAARQISDVLFFMRWLSAEPRNQACKKLKTQCNVPGKVTRFGGDSCRLCFGTVVVLQGFLRFACVPCFEIEPLKRCYLKQYVIYYICTTWIRGDQWFVIAEVPRMSGQTGIDFYNSRQMRCMLSACAFAAKPGKLLKLESERWFLCICSC